MPSSSAGRSCWEAEITEPCYLASGAARPGPVAAPRADWP